MVKLRACASLVVLAAGVPQPSTASTTTIVSVAGDEGQANNQSTPAAVSEDGRFVGFSSLADNLAPGDTARCLRDPLLPSTESCWDGFVRDRASGTTERVTVGSGGAQANNHSVLDDMSADSRFVVFGSGADNLVPDDTNGVRDVFVRDRKADVTTRISVSLAGEQGNDGSGGVYRSPSAMTPDGRYVAFTSRASNLIPGDTNDSVDVFLRDLVAGIITRVSVSSGGAEANGDSWHPSISDDGRLVAFASDTSNLVPGDTNVCRPYPNIDEEIPCTDVFIRDVLANSTTRVSVTTGGEQGDGLSYDPEISGDGTVIAFESAADNLVPGLPPSTRCRSALTSTYAAVAGIAGLGSGDHSYCSRAFAHDLASATTELVSVNETRGRNPINYTEGLSISRNGRFLAFSSNERLVAGDAPNFAWTSIGDGGWVDVYLRDRLLGTTVLVSQSTEGAHGRAASIYPPRISADGLHVAFRGSEPGGLLAPTEPHPPPIPGERLAGPVVRYQVWMRDLGVATCPDGVREDGILSHQLRGLGVEAGRPHSFSCNLARRGF